MRRPYAMPVEARRARRRTLAVQYALAGLVLAFGLLFAVVLRAAPIERSAPMADDTEAPVHHRCAELALRHCPHLRGREQDLERFPDGWSIAQAIIGGAAVQRDFQVAVTEHQPVVGHLKFAWPASMFELRP